MMINTFGKNLIKAGLTRRVLIWFLATSLVPLGLVSWISHREASNQLYKNAEASLHNLSQVQLHALNTGFETMNVDIIQESDRLANSRFLMALTSARKTAGTSASEFVGSYQWEVLKGKWASDLTIFWKEHNYSDIFLIDLQGNILFSVAGNREQGKNIFSGHLAESRLSRAAKQSLSLGKVKFSDLEFHKYKDNALSGFMVSPIIDETGEKIGLMVFQISGDYLSSLLIKKTGIHSMGTHYIIGEDLTLRSPGALGKNFPVLKRLIRTDSTLKWQSEHLAKHRHIDIRNEKIMLYQGPLGNDVLGMYTDIELNGVRWAYVSEIDAGQALEAAHTLAHTTLTLIAVMTLCIILFTLVKTRQIVGPVTAISKALSLAGKGNFQQKIEIKADHEMRELVDGFNSMMTDLKTAEESREKQTWFQEGMNQLNDQMKGDLGIEDLAGNVIGFLSRYLDAQTGVCYIVDDERIRLLGSFAFSARKGFRNEFEFGEGIVGQAALEKQMLEISDIPSDYFSIESGLGKKAPSHLCVIPMIWNDQIALILEFGTFRRFTPVQKEFISLISTAVCVAVQTALSRNQTRELLEKTQVQAEELQAREEELRDSNHLLEQQAGDLKRSQKVLQESQSELEQKNEQLRAQQEELRVANEELEEQAQDLKTSRHQVEMKNKELENAQAKLEQRAKELSVSSKYKSEFLANMSHELRTPLNSLLILARLLGENKEGNLNQKQIEYSNTIYDSGNDLLHLINEILDLSKIEAGKMEINFEKIDLDAFIRDLKRQFDPLANQKQLDFEIESETAPPYWRTDGQKLGQIIKNLLSNAFKFTAQGGVKVFIGNTDRNNAFKHRTPAENSLFISVSDNGIGIPEDRLESIFEAFQQVDGTTNRKYGGTGLGLTISRELSRLLGGELAVESHKGKGCTFTLWIPVDGTAPGAKNPGSSQADKPIEKPVFAATADQDEKTVPEDQKRSFNKNKNHPAFPAEKNTEQAEKKPAKGIQDDRNELEPGDRSILIIEDDVRFVSIMADLARTRGFKILSAEDGETGLYLADYYRPSGIILDIGLPGLDGWSVMDRLKDNSRTRHIPVHFMTASDVSHKAFSKGAVGFLTKPVSMEAMQEAFGKIENVIDRSVKRLLVVEDDKAQHTAISELLGGEDIRIEKAFTGAEAKGKIATQDFDCIVMDMGLPDMTGLELIERLQEENNALGHVPVIIYTGRELEPKERALLDKYSQRLIVKSVRSEERLLDDTTLFLHRVETELPEGQRRILKMLHDREAVFEGRNVLLVDDDMRNVFALSAILQEKRMQVTVAKNGIEALEKLEAESGIDIVLMDIMMPEMDGYEAMGKIRDQDRFRQLPIIALTAKAMKEDRIKCIRAGASDYLAKPVDSDKLLSMMRVWLYRD
nr:response regulator [uncultured Desulfobacter sp.]